jgi:DNA-binding transcriptional ArsR family regulator
MEQTHTDTDDEAYADGTMFVDVLGDEGKVRILEVLLSEPGSDMNPTRICDLAGISSSSFYNHIDTLRRWNLVTKTRMAGNSPMYQINKDSEAAQSLGKFSWDLIDYFGEKEEAGELDEDNRLPLPDEE